MEDYDDDSYLDMPSTDGAAGPSTPILPALSPVDRHDHSYMEYCNVLQYKRDIILLGTCQSKTRLILLTYMQKRFKIFSWI